MPAPITKILLVEDNPGDCRLVLEAFREIAGLQSEITRCETLTQAIDALACGKPDAALIDLGLPDAQGLDAVRRIREAAPDLPIVVLTVLNDESLGIRALKEGAQDYLIKTHIDWRTIWRALCYAIERQRVQVELLNLSFIDDLTGLYNRRGFLALAQHQLKLAYRTGKPCLVAFVDLDGMKQINDAFGHQEGNHALVEAANILRDSFRQCDILSRIGGDEFAVFIADATPDNAETVERRVKEKLNASNTDESRRYRLSMSMGIVPATNKEGLNVEDVLVRADALMYQKKQNKKARATGL